MDRNKLEGWAQCAFAVDEALDTLTRAGHRHGESIIMTNLFEALGDAREAVLESAPPELRKTWEELEERIRHLEDEGIDNVDYDVLRDEREAAYRAMYDEAWSRGGPPMLKTRLIDRDAVVTTIERLHDDAQSDEARDALWTALVACRDLRVYALEKSIADQEALAGGRRKAPRVSVLQELADRYDVGIDDIQGAHAPSCEL